MNIDNINHLRIYIQENYPMFLTNDMTLYAIIGKVVSFTNDLVSNLATLTSNFETYQNLINADMEEVKTNIETFRTEIQTKYDTFTTELTNDFNTLKTTLTNDYTTFTTEQLSNINTFITNATQELADYKTEVETKLSTLEASLTETVENYKTQFDTELNNITSTLSTTVNTEINNLITDGTITNILNTMYGSVYTLTYLQETTPSIGVFGQYYYDTTNNKLYYWENQKWDEIDVNSKSIYLYNNAIYVPVLSGETYILQQVGV